VAVDGSGNVYIADTAQQRDQGVERVDAAGDHAGVVGAEPAQGVAVDGSGNVYIADTLNSAIKEWSASTQQVTTLVSSGLS
jgi:sugar lactone lactonase YvrE